jgi:hypothetical protein
VKLSANANAIYQFTSPPGASSTLSLSLLSCVVSTTTHATVDPTNNGSSDIQPSALPYLLLRQGNVAFLPGESTHNPNSGAFDLQLACPQSTDEDPPVQYVIPVPSPGDYYLTFQAVDTGETTFSLVASLDNGMLCCVCVVCVCVCCMLLFVFPGVVLVWLCLCDVLIALHPLIISEYSCV